MSVKQNKAAIRRHFDEVLSKGNLSVIDELYSPDFVGHEPTLGETVRGPEVLKQFLTTYRQAFPDLKVTLDDVFGERDQVVCRWTATATHTGEILGLKPTGRRGTVTGCSINRFENGKIVEGWGNWDTLGMMQQLGLVPPMEELLGGSGA